MIVLLLATACTADAQAFSPAATQPKSAHDTRCLAAVGAWRSAIEVGRTPPGEFQSSAETVLSRCSHDWLGQSLRSEVIASAEFARVQRLRAGATVTPYEPPSRADTLVDKALVDAAPPPTTSAASVSRGVTFCMAKLDSLKSLLNAIETRRHQITGDLSSGDVHGAQAAYDVIRWATEDLADSGRALVERCRESAAEAAAEAQVTVGMAQAAWQAAESDCHARFAQQGLDCG